VSGSCRSRSRLLQTGRNQVSPFSCTPTKSFFSSLFLLLFFLSSSMVYLFPFLSLPLTSNRRLQPVSRQFRTLHTVEPLRLLTIFLISLRYFLRVVTFDEKLYLKVNTEKVKIYPSPIGYTGESDTTGFLRRLSPPRGVSLENDALPITA